MREIVIDGGDGGKELRLSIGSGPDKKGFEILLDGLAVETKFLAGQQFAEIWLTRIVYGKLMGCFAKRKFSLKFNGFARDYFLMATESAEMAILDVSGKIAAKIYVDDQLPPEALLPEIFCGLITHS